jgi:hypothetical protein
MTNWFHRLFRLEMALAAMTFTAIIVTAVILLLVLTLSAAFQVLVHWLVVRLVA